MKLSIHRNDLLDAVNKVKSIVSARSALPILSHILLEAEGSSVRLSATDLKVSIECLVDCTVERPGSMTLSSQRISSILPQLPDADIQLELTDSNVVRLTCGKIDTKLFSMAPEEFPPIKSFDGIESLVLPRKMLKNMFNKTSFAICTDQARHNLTGLLIEISGGKMTAVATDGRRMSLFRDEEGIAEGIEIKAIIPGKLIHELERLLDDENDVEVFIGENQAAFSFNSIRLVTSLIEGTFPNYEIVIPKNHDKEALVPTEQFVKAMRRTCTMTNEKFNSVRIKISNGLMNLKVVTPEVGEYEEDLVIKYDGDPVEIAFNPDFVLEVLQHIDPDTTSLVLKDAMSPGVIKPHHDAPHDNYVNVVMPIRI